MEQGEIAFDANVVEYNSTFMSKRRLIQEAQANPNDDV
jgi:hypothetical protein